MAYLILARKYRPQRFADVIGQEHVTRTLLNAIAQGRIAHGYIFSGHRGIGKTTVARILAMALNCRHEIGSPERPSPEPCGLCVSCEEIRAGNSVDMLEIDAATNRGIDEIRELRDAARYSPARDRYKICLLDEAHQITDAAFNALLKTLEEPPEHVIFMMATTQPEDIPQTIRSRCQHYSFHAVKFDDILAQLRQIASAESISAEDEALALVAEAGDGSMRDALSIMDQAIASAPELDGKPRLEASQIRALMGSVPNATLEDLLGDIHNSQAAASMERIDRLLNEGTSAPEIARQMVRFLRNCLMAKLGGESSELLEISADERKRAARSAAPFSEQDLTRFLDVMLRTFDELNYRQEQRFHLELGILKLVELERLIPLEEILNRLPGARTHRAASSGAHASEVRTASPHPTSGGASPSQAVSAVWKPKAAPPASHNHQSSEPRLAATGVQPAPENSGDWAGTANPDAVRNAAVEALRAAGHAAAADMLSSAHWTTRPGGPVEAEVATSKTMVDLAMTAEATRIAREAIAGAGAGRKFSVVAAGHAGDHSGNHAASVPALAEKPGSIQEMALSNPLVRQAQEIFHAEVRSVLDLREASHSDERRRK